MSCLLLVAAVTAVVAGAQESNFVAGQPAAIPAISATEAAIESAVPALVRYTGEMNEQAGKRVALRFAVYASATSTSALWSESQNVTVAPDGKYAVLLGAASSIGLPSSLFAPGETRWLAIAIGDGPEIERAMLVSVPYAIKAGDAETLSGHPVAELVTQDQLRGAVAAQLASQQLAARQILPDTTTPTPITGTGTTNYLPFWTSASTLGSSILIQSGTGAAAKIGIGTAAPATTLDVFGGFSVRGDMIVQPQTIATASAAVNSPPFFFDASAYSSSLAAAVPQKFVFETVATGNNSASPSSNLQIWYGAGTSAPTPTGLSIGTNGIITFASGQTFPGVSTSGGIINASTYDLGGARFEYGNQSNAFLAYAGNGSVGSGSGNLGVGSSALNALTSGSNNSAVGSATLANNTSGTSNTAIGVQALQSNTTGSGNTAVGGAAMVYNYTGSNNTAIGDAAGPDSASTALTGATAIGWNAKVSASNALVLGQTTSGSPGASSVNVGVGTSTPVSELELSKNVEDGMGPVLTLTNGGGTSGASGYHPATTAIDFKTYLHASTATSPTSRIEAVDDDYGNELSFYTKTYGADSNKLVDQVDIGSSFAYAIYVNGFMNVCCTDGVGPPTVADIGGSLEVDGEVYASTDDVRVDHPLDPANQTLTQSSITSSERMNLYSGNVTTDENGLAIVKLPTWFESENGDFRYQLTTIGRDAHAWVAEEIGNHQFKIATNATFVKVSWQITATRQDAYAKANPLVVEKLKPVEQRGYYLNPALFGQPTEKNVRWASKPRDLAKRKATIQAQAQSTATAK
jgi:hypothetical protein